MDLNKLNAILHPQPVKTVQTKTACKTRQTRVQYGENINKIDSQSVFCSGS